MSGWPEFAAGLAAELSALPAGAVVKVAERSGSRYAQFRQLDDRLWAELSGDLRLDPDTRVGVSGARLLVASGWQLPDPGHGDNWWIEWAWPLSPRRYRALAAMVVGGLGDVFRIAGPHELVYDAWNEDAENRDLVLPGLGVSRRM